MRVELDERDMQDVELLEGLVDLARRRARRPEPAAAPATPARPPVRRRIPRAPSAEELAKAGVTSIDIEKAKRDQIRGGKAS